MRNKKFLEHLWQNEFVWGSQLYSRYTVTGLGFRQNKLNLSWKYIFPFWMFYLNFYIKGSQLEIYFYCFTKAYIRKVYRTNWMSNLAEWLEVWLTTSITPGGQGSNPLRGALPLPTQCIKSNWAKLNSTKTKEVIRQ